MKAASDMFCNCSEYANFHGDFTAPSVPALCQHAQTQRGNKTRAALQRIARQSREDSLVRKDDETFNARLEVERIRARRAEARRQIYRKSRLHKYRAELVAMKREGASCADLAEWLRISHRMKVHRSSIDRFLKKLQEMNATQQVEGETFVEEEE